MHVKSEVVALAQGGWGSRMTDGDKGPRRDFKKPCLLPFQYTLPVTHVLPEAGRAAIEVLSNI